VRGSESAGLCIHIYVMSRCFSWGKRVEREPDDTRSNAETEIFALTSTSVSLCVFEASSVQHGEKFLFRFL
jgi:hypothetical protein